MSKPKVSIIKPTGNLRSKIYQASWNYQYRKVLPKFSFYVGLIIGIVTLSPLIGLLAWAVVVSLPHSEKTVGYISNICGLIAALFGGTVMYSAVGFEAMIVGAFVCYAIVYVPLRGSEQYWRDLEKDGGPYKD